MIKNIIFDWSGVIMDDLTTVYETIMAIFGKFGVEEISLEEFRKKWEQPYMKFYNKYCIKRLKKEEEIDLFGSLYKVSAAKNPPKIHLNIKDSLKKFKTAGINMVVLSSNLKDSILSDIRKFELDGVFKEINSDVHDKAEFIHEIIQRNNFNPGETIFIGDTAHEVEAGKKGGTKTGAVTWGYNYEDKLKIANPDFIIHNLKELESIILG